MSNTPPEFNINKLQKDAYIFIQDVIAGKGEIDMSKNDDGIHYKFPSFSERIKAAMPFVKDVLKEHQEKLEVEAEYAEVDVEQLRALLIKNTED